MRMHKGLLICLCLCIVLCSASALNQNNVVDKSISSAQTIQRVTPGSILPGGSTLPDLNITSASVTGSRMSIIDWIYIS
jgi:heme O synthase-like polyprenyltransferase